MTQSIIAKEIEILNKYKIKKVSYAIDIVDIPTDKKYAKDYYSTLKIDLSLDMDIQPSVIYLPLSYFTCDTLKRPPKMIGNMISSITVDNVDSNNIEWTTCKTDDCSGENIDFLKISIMGARVKNEHTHLNIKYKIITPQPTLYNSKNKKPKIEKITDIYIQHPIFCLRQNLSRIHKWIKQIIDWWLNQKIDWWLNQKIDWWIKKKIDWWVEWKKDDWGFRKNNNFDKKMRHFELPIIDSKDTPVISLKFSSPNGWKFADVTNILPLIKNMDDKVRIYGDCPIRHVHKKVPLSCLYYQSNIRTPKPGSENQLILSSLSREDLFVDTPNKSDGTVSTFLSHNWEYGEQPKKSTWVIDIYKKNMWDYVVKSAKMMSEMMSGCKFRKWCVLSCDEYQEKLKDWYFPPCNDQSSKTDKTDITVGSYVLRKINFKIEAGSKSKLTVALSRCLLILSILFGIIFAFSLITTPLVDDIEWINYIFAEIGHITVVVAFFFSYCLEKENGMQFYVSDRRIQNQIIISALVSIFCAVLLIIRFTISL